MTGNPCLSLVSGWAVQINSDLAALLDEWATSLFRELDYTREARNGIRFRELYRHLKVWDLGTNSSLSRKASNREPGRIQRQILLAHTFGWSGPVDYLD